MAKEEKTKTETMRPFEEWAALLATPPWLLAAARAKENWPEGREVSESEYRAALKAAQSEVIR